MNAVTATTKAVKKDRVANELYDLRRRSVSNPPEMMPPVAFGIPTTGKGRHRRRRGSKKTRRRKRS
jgi:hypothetical protein